MKIAPVRLGLTGGIGSGKSTVAGMLQKLGAVIVDADAISRTSTATNGVAITEIAAVFGPEFIDSDRALNRQKMRETIFKDPAAKSKLERIVHPLIRKEMLAQAVFASSNGAACVVFDIPLLVESGTWRNFVHSVLVIDCTGETQLQRVKERSGLTNETIQRIVASQTNREDRLRAADFVIFNNSCSTDQLAISVRAIASKIGL